MRLLRAWESFWGYLGYLRRNRRQRKASVANRRDLRRRHRMDTLEQRVVLNADAVDDSLSTDYQSPVVIAGSQLTGNDFYSGTPTLSLPGSTAYGGSLADNYDGTYTYTPAGGFSGTDYFSYTLSDEDPSSDSATVSISVGSPAPQNNAPYANDVTFNHVIPYGSSSYYLDLSSDVPQTPYDYGDQEGTPSISYSNYGGTNVNPGEQLSYGYTVTDADGLSASATVYINIVEDAPPPQNNAPYANDVTFNHVIPYGSSSYYLDLSGDVPQTPYDYGDQEGTPSISYSNYGGTNVNPGQQLSYGYTVTDADGLSASATVYINIVEDAPPTNNLPYADNAVFELRVPYGSGGGYYDLSTYIPQRGTHYDDPDGDGLTLTYGGYGWTYVSPGQQYSSTYSVDDGRGGFATATVFINIVEDYAPPSIPGGPYTINEDTTLSLQTTNPGGQPLSLSVVSGPTHGSLAIDAAGLITYTPEANYFGTDSFSCYVSDGQQQSSPATVTVEIQSVDDAPAAMSDVLTVPEDGSISFMASDLIGNDSDPESGVTFVRIVQSPTNGTLAEWGSGNSTQFAYTPAANYCGGDSFVYEIVDGTGNLAQATVTINVTPVNDAPIAGGDDAGSMSEDGALVVWPSDWLSNDSDDEGAPTLQSVSASTGTLVANGNGSYTFTPPEDFTGTTSLIYTIVDSQGLTGSAAVTISVTPVNDAPTATGGAHSITEGSSLTLSSDDVDGDALLSAQVSLGPSYGSVTFTNGTLTYTPSDPDFFGSDAFEYAVFDGQEWSSPVHVDVTVTPVNDAPTISAPTAQLLTTTGATLVFSAAGGNALAVGDVEAGAKRLTLEVDHGQLSYGAGSSAQSLIISGTVAQLNAALEGLRFHAPANYAGPAALTITVDDQDTTGGGALSATANVALRVQPRITVADASGVEGSVEGTVRFTVNLTAAYDQPVTVAYQTLPSSASSADFVSQSGMLTFAAGTTMQYLDVAIPDDQIAEYTEGFLVAFSGATNAVIDTPSADGSITDNDPDPTVTVESVEVSETTGWAVVHFKLSHESEKNVYANWSAADGSAVAPYDYGYVWNQNHQEPYAYTHYVMERSWTDVVTHYNYNAYDVYGTESGYWATSYWGAPVETPFIEPQFTTGTPDPSWVNPQPDTRPAVEYGYWASSYWAPVEVPFGEAQFTTGTPPSSWVNPQSDSRPAVEYGYWASSYWAPVEVPFGEAQFTTGTPPSSWVNPQPDSRPAVEYGYWASSFWENGVETPFLEPQFTTGTPDPSWVNPQWGPHDTTESGYSATSYWSTAETPFLEPQFTTGTPDPSWINPQWGPHNTTESGYSATSYWSTAETPFLEPQFTTGTPDPSWINPQWGPHNTTESGYSATSYWAPAETPFVEPQFTTGTPDPSWINPQPGTRPVFDHTEAAGSTTSGPSAAWVNGYTEWTEEFPYSDSLTTDSPSIYEAQGYHIVSSWTETGTTNVPAWEPYGETSGQVYFAPHSLDATAQIYINDDGETEADETINIQLNTPTSAIVGSSSAGTVTIVDNETPHAPQAQDKTYAIWEVETLTVDAEHGLLAGVWDVNGDSFSISAYTEPSSGSVSIDQVTGAFSYTPSPFWTGTDSFTCDITDSQGYTRTVTVNISCAMNDAPTFTLGDNVSVTMGVGAQEIENFLTGLSMGPSDESDQTYTLTVLNDNAELFTEAGQPAIVIDESGVGKLTFTPQFSGSALITVKIQDNGGTTAGGRDTTTKTFWIDVAAPSGSSGSTSGIYANAVAAAPQGPAIRVPHEQFTDADDTLTFLDDRTIAVAENLPATTQLRVELTVAHGTLSAPSAQGDGLVEPLVLVGARQQINDRLQQLEYEAQAGFLGRDLLAIRVLAAGSAPAMIATVAIGVRSQATLVGPSQVSATMHKQQTYNVTISRVDDFFNGDLTVDWGDGSSSDAPLSETTVASVLTGKAPHTYETTGSFTQVWTLIDGDRTVTWETEVTVAEPSFAFVEYTVEYDESWLGEGAKGTIRGKVTSDGSSPSELTLNITAGDESAAVEIDEDGNFQWNFQFDDDNPTETDGDWLSVTLELTDDEELTAYGSVGIFLRNLAPFVVADPFQEELDSPEHRYWVAQLGEYSTPVYYEPVAPQFVMPTFGDNPEDTLTTIIHDLPNDDMQGPLGLKHVLIEVVDDDGRSYFYEKTWMVYSAAIPVEGAITGGEYNSGIENAWGWKSTNVEALGGIENESFSAAITVDAADPSALARSSYVYLEEGEPANGLDLGALVGAHVDARRYYNQLFSTEVEQWQTYYDSAANYSYTTPGDDVYVDMEVAIDVGAPQVRFELVYGPGHDPSFELSEDGVVTYHQAAQTFPGGETYFSDSFTYRVIASVTTPDNVVHEAVVREATVNLIGYTVTKSNTITASVIDGIAAEDVLRVDGTKAPEDAENGDVVKNGAVVRFVRTQVENYQYGMTPPSSLGITPPHEAVESTKPRGNASVTFHLSTDADPASATDDLEAEQTTVEFAEGETVKDVVLTAKFDTLKERDETIRVIVTASTGVDQPLDAESDEDDLQIGTVTVVDSDQILAWGSNNVDTASSGLMREQVLIDGRMVDLFDGRWSWQAPFGPLATFYSGLMTETFASYHPTTEAGEESEESPDQAARRTDAWREAQNAEHGTLLRPWLGISDVGTINNPNPTTDSGYFGYVDFLVPVARLQRDSAIIGAETWNGVLLVRRDGSSAWFDATPFGASISGTTSREGEGVNAVEKRTYTNLTAGRYYYLQVPAGATDLVAGGLYQADADGKIEVTAAYRWYQKNIDGEYTYSPSVLDNVTLFSDLAFSSPAGTFGTLSTAGDTESRFELSLRDGTRFEFNDAGLLRAAFDRSDNKTTYDYNRAAYPSQARLSKITLPTGGEIALHYENIDSRILASVTDPAGTSTYIRDGQVFSAAPQISGTNGGSSALAVGIGGQLRAAEVTDDDVDDVHIAATTSFLADLTYTEQGVEHYRRLGEGDLGRLEAVDVDEADKEARATYRGAYQVGEAAPSKWEYQFDRFGLITAKAAPSDAQNPVEDVWQWERNVDGLVVFERTPAGRGYTDGIGDLQPDYGGFDIKKLEYDDDGNLLKVTYGYDPADPESTGANPWRTTEEWQYGVNGQVRQYTDRTDQTTVYDLTEKGDVNFVQDALGNRTYYGYTYSASGRPAGLVEWMLDAEGGVTQYEYYSAADGAAQAGRVKFIKHGAGTPEERKEEFYYDDRGNLQRHVDVNNVATGYQYDHLGQLLEERIGVTVDPTTGANSGGALVAKYTYDSAGNQRTKFVAAELGSDGYVTSYAYDAWNRLQKVTEPNVAGSYKVAPTTEYAYTADGLIRETKVAIVDGDTTTIDAAPKHTVTSQYDVRRQKYREVESGASEGVVRRNGGAAYTGNTTTEYKYDGAGNVQSIQDPLNRITYFTYDADGNKIRTTAPDPDGPGSDSAHALTNFVTRTEYDAAGRIIKQFSPSPTGTGVVYTRNYYNAAGQLIRVQQPALTAPSGTTHAGEVYYLFTAYEYYDNGKLKAERSGVSFANEPTSSQQLNDDGTTKITELNESDIEQRKTEYEYDALGRTTRKEVTVAGSAASSVTSTDYDVVNGVLVVTETSPRQYQTVMTYDNYGRVAQVQKPAPGTDGEDGEPLAAPLIKYDYYDNGLLHREIKTHVGAALVDGSDPNGLVTTYSYDEQKRVIRLKAEGEVTRYEYDNQGNVLEEFVDNRRRTTYRYNERGDRISSLELEPSDRISVVEQTFVYDEVGQMQYQVANGTRTNFGYDALDRLVMERPHNSFVPNEPSISYTPAGNQKTFTSQAGPVTLQFDALGREISREFIDIELGGHLKKSITIYDDADLKRTVVDEFKKVAVESTFDGVGRLIRQETFTIATDGQFVPSGTQDFEYDGAGNLVLFVDDGQETVYAYDSLDRRTAQIGVTEPNSYQPTYTYDDYGRIKKIADPKLTFTYYYGADGTLDKLTRVVGDTSLTYAIPSFEEFWKNADLKERVAYLKGIIEYHANLAIQSDVRQVIDLLLAAGDGGPIDLPPVLYLGEAVAASDSAIEQWYSAEARAIRASQLNAYGQAQASWAEENAPHPLVTALYEISGLRDLREGTLSEKLLAVAALLPNVVGYVGKTWKLIDRVDDVIDAVRILDRANDLQRTYRNVDRTSDLARLANRVDNLAPSNRLLGSIEDAAKFEKSHFANRFVGENALSDVQGSLESAFSGRGMTFDGIFTGQSSSRFVPRFDVAGNIVGGRINLVGSSQRQPLVRVLDEVTHSLDAVHPRFQSRFERLMQIGAVDPDRARVFQHYQLFRRAANQFEAGDQTLGLLLREGDAELLRRLATELRR